MSGSCGPCPFGRGKRDLSGVTLSSEHKHWLGSYMIEKDFSCQQMQDRWGLARKTFLRNANNVKEGTAGAPASENCII
jgi:hypothetical protein